MIYDSKITFINDRQPALNYIKNLKTNNQNFTLIDIGICANAWTREFVTHGVDIEKYEMPIIQFTGNISDTTVWNEILEYVEKNGKFDFLTCTHTLEDISAAVMVCNMFSKIAKEGFIAVPSKYWELARHEGNWRGFIHHRWIFDIKDNQFFGYPKQSFLENVGEIDSWLQSNKNTIENVELQFFWKEEIKLNVVNNDLLGPTVNHVIQYYTGLIL